MNLTSEHFKGTRAGSAIRNQKELVQTVLEKKFSNGVIDADLFHKAMEALYPEKKSDDLQKGEIMDRLGYGYGSGGEPIKFTKTGKELKEMLPGVVGKLNGQKSVILGQMAAYMTLAGIDPTEDYHGLKRYPWNCCEQPYDEVMKKYPESTDVNKACRSYNDCCYQIRSIDEDIRACQAIISGVDDKQKYNLTIGQLMALNVA